MSNDVAVQETSEPNADARAAGDQNENPCFSTFGVSQATVEALRARGIDATFPIQALVLPDAIAGRDVLAKSRTGSGKTLGFAVPMVERLVHDRKSPTALVLVPTRELATQVAEEFMAIAGSKKLKVATVYGGTSVAGQGKAARDADILVATPGRMIDLVNRRMVTLERVRIAVLDEADRMLDMGFLPDVNKILAMLPQEGRQTMMFSATLDGEVGRLAKRYTQNPARHEIADTRPVVETADHRFITVEQHGKVQALINELNEERGRTLIFVRTKRGADRLASSLKTHGFTAQALHGDMRQQQREKALERFEEGTHDVLVATDVAARGLDIDGITHVVNYDPPEDDKGYVHRIGRTARAGRSGVGITLVLPDQRFDVSRLAARLKLHDELTASGMKVHAPRSVFTTRGKGRNSLLGRRPKRRF